MLLLVLCSIDRRGLKLMEIWMILKLWSLMIIHFTRRKRKGTTGVGTRVDYPKCLAEIQRGTFTSFLLVKKITDNGCQHRSPLFQVL